MTPKRLRLAALALLTLAVLSGCSATPEPDPTPTPAFASEEEAYAAAEATYREYNEAVNARIDGDSDSKPQDFLIGLALEAYYTELNTFRELGIHLEGFGSVKAFSPESASLSPRSEKVVASICTDSTGTRVIDEAGKDVTPSARPDTSVLTATFVLVNDEFLISDLVLVSDVSC